MRVGGGLKSVTAKSAYIFRMYPCYSPAAGIVVPDCYCELDPLTMAVFGRATEETKACSQNA